MFNVKRMNFSAPMTVEVGEDDELNSYHKIYKCFPPDFNSQLIVSSYSSSPYNEHHSLHKINYTKTDANSLEWHSSMIKRVPNFGGSKLSVDNRNVALLSRKEFSIVNKGLTDCQRR